MNSFAALWYPGDGPLLTVDFLAADETVPLSLVPVNCKPLYIVLCCRSWVFSCLTPDSGCGKLRAGAQNTGFTVLRPEKAAQKQAEPERQALRLRLAPRRSVNKMRDLCSRSGNHVEVWRNRRKRDQGRERFGKLIGANHLPCIAAKAGKAGSKREFRRIKTNHRAWVPISA